MYKGFCFILLLSILSACGKKVPLDRPPSDEEIKPRIYPKGGGDEEDFSVRGS